MSKAKTSKKAKVVKSKARKFSYSAEPEDDERSEISAEVAAVLDGAEDSAASVVADEVVVKEGQRLNSYTNLFRTLLLCGLTPIRYHTSFFMKYLYPFIAFCMVILGSVLWQIIYLAYFQSNVNGWSILAIEFTATLNWLFLKYFIGRGALETVLRSVIHTRNYTVFFHRHVKFVVAVGVFSTVLATVTSVVLVFFTIPNFYSVGVFEVYKSHLWQMILWYIFTPLSTIIWTGSLFLFFGIYYMMGAVLRHETNELKVAVEEHHIDSRLFVDWHRGIHHLLRQTNASFGVICALYTVTFLVVIVIAVSHIIGNIGTAPWLNQLIAAFSIVLLGSLVVVLLVPGAMVTASCEDIYRAASDVIGFVYTHPNDGAAAAGVQESGGYSSDRGAEQVERRVELRVIGVTLEEKDDLSLRGAELRESARALERAFHNHAHAARTDARLAAKLTFAESNERRRRIDESWGPAYSAGVLEYLRASDMNFKILGMTVTHGFNAKLAYSFISLITIVARITT